MDNKMLQFEQKFEPIWKKLLRLIFKCSNFLCGRRGQTWLSTDYVIGYLNVSGYVILQQSM